MVTDDATLPNFHSLVDLNSSSQVADSVSSDDIEPQHKGKTIIMDELNISGIYLERPHFFAANEISFCNQKLTHCISITN